MRLDVADGAVQMRAAAQRPVHEEQVVGVGVLLAEQQRQLHLRVAESLLERERQLIHARPAAFQAG